MADVLSRLGARMESLKGFSACVSIFALGAVSAAAFPPFGFIPAWFLALTLFFHRLSKAGVREAAVLGFAFGIGQFAAGLYWIANSFYAQDEVAHWLAPIAVALLVLYLSLYPAFAAWLARYLMSGPPAFRALILAAAFTLAEWLRGVLFTGFPWNIASLIWSPSTEMMQSASLLGAYGLSFVSYFAAALLAPLFDGERSVVSRIKEAAAAAGIFLLFFAGGAVRLTQARVEYVEGVQLRIVQANIPQGEKWDEAKLRANLDLYLRMSRAGREGLAGVTHVLWPETAIPFDVANSSATRALIMEGLNSDAMLIAGATRLELLPNIAIYNSVFALKGGGVIEGVYDKAHLVPFGEFMPWRGLLSKFGMDTLAPGDLDFSKGPGPVTLHLSGLPPVSPLVCYEVIFPGAVLDPTDRPAWLLNLTNDAWFGETPGPYQHLALARFRAVEEGLALVRAAGTGISAIVDPYGRLVRSLNLSTRGVLDSGLPAALHGATVFARLKNIPV
ncbi:MAG TPA: apolipoprotein N-acyltransferase, partial [Sphingomonadales bacterium]|nr:apolipoprotein N-acyltransferase [Sphingomonadales bacterium]